MRFKAPRGTRDVLPPESNLWLFVEDTFRRVCARYGYQEIRTPTFEDTELFTRGLGEGSDVVSKEMYTFVDRGGRSLTLRPEGTAPVVRAYIEHGLARQNTVHKFSYIISFFRYERPQAGRLREPHQVGVEALGSPSPLLDAEVVALGMDYCAELGMSGHVLSLNSIGCPACRPRYREELQRFIEPILAELCPDCQRRYATNPLRVLDCKEERCKQLTAEAPTTLDFLCDECRDHFDEVLRLLDAAQVPYEIDRRLVRGLDYYTRTAFEIKHPSLGAQDAVLGGGRYDGLVEACGGKPTPGIGFGSGIERCLLALGEEAARRAPAPPRPVFVAPLGAQARPQAFALISALRQAGIAVETDYFERSLKAQLKAADRLGAPLAVILGEDELRENKVLLRDLASGEQTLVPWDEAVQAIAGRLGEDHACCS